MFQAPGRTIAHIFCEPESTLGRALLARLGGGPIKGLSAGQLEPHASSLRQAYGDGLSDEELEDIALEGLFAWAQHTPSSAADHRVLSATAFMAARLAEPLMLEDVAGHVELSPGRFRHLFVEQTGISFRAYLLWARLNRALELGFGGASWTEAAHATNFADSAHLTRTMRRMYGFAPSALRQDIPAAARPLTA